MAGRWRSCSSASRIETQRNPYRQSRRRRPRAGRRCGFAGRGTHVLVEAHAFRIEIAGRHVPPISAGRTADGLMARTRDSEIVGVFGACPLIEPCGKDEKRLFNFGCPEGLLAVETICRGHPAGRVRTAKVARQRLRPNPFRRQCYWNCDRARRRRGLSANCAVPCARSS